MYFTKKNTSQRKNDFYQYYDILANSSRPDIFLEYSSGMEAMVYLLPLLRILILHPEDSHFLADSSQCVPTQQYIYSLIIARYIGQSDF